MVGIGVISFIPKRTDVKDNNNNMDVEEQQQKELVPMTGIDFHIKMLDYSAEVTIRQRFENREKSPIEATYEIILPRECAVTAFTADVAGERIAAVVKEKEAAKDEYEDAMAAGGSAVLLENDLSDDKPDVFRVSVGNLAPQAAALVALTYVTTATVTEAGELEFTLPAAQGKQDIVIAPPAPEGPSAEDNGGVADGVHLRADIETGSDIRAVTSPTHRVTFELGDTPRKARVTLNDTLRGGDDFTLAVRTAEPRAPSARVHKPAADKPAATVMASFFPDLEAALADSGNGDDDGVKEMVFVVDRSGSMSGSKVENAKSTLQLFLRSIPEGTLFNIVSFGSRFSKLFEDGSRALDDATLRAATEHVAAMSANMGGTNLSAPLRSVFAEAARENVPRLLFVLTDGQVHDADACMRCIREQAQTTRVFTFGIGRDASVALVRGMARAGEGLCELIEDATDMREKVVRQLKRAVKPALTGLTLAWEGCGAVRQAPHLLPPLFHGTRLVAYGFAEDAAALTAPGAAAVLRGTLGGSRPFESRVALGGLPVHVGEGDEAQVSKLAAAALLRDLDEGRSYHGKDFPAKDRDAETVRVSLAYGVLSKRTAFVAVTAPKPGASPAQESMVERPVTIRPYAEPTPRPVLFSCCGGARGGFAPRRMMMRCAAPRMMATCCDAGAAPMMMMKKGRGGAPRGRKEMETESVLCCAKVAAPAMMECCDDAEMAGAAAEVADVGPIPLTQERVVLEQSANGSWAPECLARLDPAFADAMAAVPAKTEDETLRRVWATLVALAILKVRYGKTTAEWELLRDKALAWVRKVTKTAADFNMDVWTKAAEDYVSKK